MVYKYTMQGWWINFLRSAVFKQHIIDDWQAWIYPKKGRFNNEKRGCNHSPTRDVTNITLGTSSGQNSSKTWGFRDEFCRFRPNMRGVIAALEHVGKEWFNKGKYELGMDLNGAPRKMSGPWFVHLPCAVHVPTFETNCFADRPHSLSTTDLHWSFRVHRWFVGVTYYPLVN